MANKMTKGKVVIIHPGKVPIEEHAHLVIHAQLGDVIELLMQKLDLQIPEFKLQKCLKITLNGEEEKGDEIISVNAIDSKWENENFLKQITINEEIGSKHTLNKDVDVIKLDLEFLSNYNEQPLTIFLPKAFIKKYSKRYQNTLIINLSHNMTKWEQPYACRYSKYDCNL